MRHSLRSSLLLSFVCSIYAQDFPYIPEGNKVYLGAWPDAQAGYSDSPAAMNSRLSPVPQLSSYQITQNIPITTYSDITGAGGTANTSAIDATSTNASVYLTVYMSGSSFTAVSDQDLTDLGTQIKDIQKDNRVVFLRFLPEMNGNWFSYGVQPVAFVDLWRRMHDTVKNIAPDTVLVWAPNYSYGYPYGMAIPSNTTEADALDTNHDGSLTNEDDSYAPYYPGDSYVDWNGLSVYYKGPGFQSTNQGNAPQFCQLMLEGRDPYYNTSYTPFYDTYCSQNNKPCWFAEIGGAYQVNATQPGVSQLELQQAWYRSCITNTTLLDLYPMIKGLMLFEYEKVEEESGMSYLRDYRLTNATDILTSFKQDLEAIQDRFQWATNTSSSSSSSGPTLKGDGSAQTLTVLSPLITTLTLLLVGLIMLLSL